MANATLPIAARQAGDPVSVGVTVASNGRVRVRARVTSVLDADFRQAGLTWLIWLELNGNLGPSSDYDGSGAAHADRAAERWDRMEAERGRKAVAGSAKAAVVLARHTGTPEARALLGTGTPAVGGDIPAANAGDVIEAFAMVVGGPAAFGIDLVTAEG